MARFDTRNLERERMTDALPYRNLTIPPVSNYSILDGKITMKRLASVALLIGTAACNAGTNVDAVPDLSNALTGLPTEVVIGFGEEVRVEGGVLHLSFAEVLEDSRCPRDVTCVWEGNGEVRIGIAAGMGPTHPLDLNTTLDPRSADWNGVRVTLLEITPAPISTDPIELEDYAIRLRVEEIP